MSANGGVAMQLAFNLFLTFLGLSLNAYLVSWVANKFDAQTTPQEVLKVNWYSYASVSYTHLDVYKRQL